jgi:hypothetical protein
MKTQISKQHTNAVAVQSQTTLDTTFIPGLFSKALSMLLLAAALVLPGAAQTIYVSNNTGYNGNPPGETYISEYYLDGTLVNGSLITIPTAEVGGLAVSGASLYAPTNYLCNYPGCNIDTVNQYNANTGVAGWSVNLMPQNSQLFMEAAAANSKLFVLEYGGEVVEYDAASGQKLGTFTDGGGGNIAQHIAVWAPATGFGWSVPTDVFVTNQVYGQSCTGGTIQKIVVSANNVQQSSTPIVSGLDCPEGIAVSADGNDLYVLVQSPNNGAVGDILEYTTAGVPVGTLVSGISGTPWDIAVSGPNLLVLLNTGNAIAEYNATTGATVNASLVTGLDSPLGIAVGPGVCVTPPSNMVAWYPFDLYPYWISLSGPLAEGDLANGNTATAYGATSIPGEVADALAFDGISNYVEAPDQSWLNMGTGDFSIDAWVRINSSADDSGVVVLLDKRESSPIQGYHFFLYNGLLGVQLANNDNFTNYVSTTAVPPDGAWHLIAVTVHRAKNGGTWYLDNKAVGTFDPSAYNGLSLDSTGVPLVFGKREIGLGGDGFFKGGMDELEIFNRALSPAEVLSLYHAGSAGKCK